MITQTSCNFCSSRCGILLHIEGEKITRVEGDPSHPVSRGWTCARGRAATAKRFTLKNGPALPRLSNK